MKKLFLIQLLCLSLFANWKISRENLQYLYNIDDFRIFYSLSGVNAVSDKTDLNKNNIPDIIESIGNQLKNANEIFSKQLNFIKPLKNRVYKNRAQYIDIHILKLKNNINGLTGDAVIKYDYKIAPSNGKSISIAISNKLKKGNLTPLHELFHAYQNGYSMIKNRWYTEGTAKLMQEVARKKKFRSKKLPQNKEELGMVLSKTYSNYSFWKRLDELCSNNNYKFLVKYLSNLALQEKEIEKKYNLSKFKWEEKYQKNSRNDIYILKSIKNTILDNKNQCNINEEMINFLEIVE